MTKRILVTEELHPRGMAILKPQRMSKLYVLTMLNTKRCVTQFRI